MENFKGLINRNLKAFILIIVIGAILTVGKNFYIISAHVTTTDDALKTEKLSTEAWKDKAIKESDRSETLLQSINAFKKKGLAKDSLHIHQLKIWKTRYSSLQFKLDTEKDENDSLRAVIRSIRQSDI